MRIETTTAGGTPVHSISGDFTFAHHEEALRLVERVRGVEAGTHVMELSRVDRVDATGYGVIVLIALGLATAGHRVVVRGARGEVRRYLALAKLDRLAPIQVID